MLNSYLWVFEKFVEANIFKLNFLFAKVVNFERSLERETRFYRRDSASTYFDDRKPAKQFITKELCVCVSALWDVSKDWKEF